MAKLKVTLKKSVIGTPQTQRLTVKSIGLKKTNSSVIVNDDPAMKGQLHKVRHLVEVEQIEE